MIIYFFPHRSVSMNKNNYTLEFLIIYKVIYMYSLDLPGGPVVKNPTNARDTSHAGSIPGLGRSPGGGNGKNSSILAWKILQAEETDGLQSMGSQSWT